MIKILQRLFAPKIITYNILCSIPFEYSKDSLMVEFKVAAYNENEALSLAQKIVDDFNQKEDSNIVFDKLWKVSDILILKINKVPVSFYTALGNKFKFSQKELFNIFSKNANLILKNQLEYVLSKDFKIKSMDL